jgi:hypothetical protein
MSVAQIHYDRRQYFSIFQNKRIICLRKKL